MSSKPKAKLEQALNGYLSNRSTENIIASANSTRKIVDLVRGDVAIPGSDHEPEKPLTGSAPGEPEWMETIRNLAEHCDPQSVENSGRERRDPSQGKVSGPEGTLSRPWGEMRSRSASTYRNKSRKTNESIS